MHKDSDALSIAAAQELMTNLGAAGLVAALCEGPEIMEMLFCFFNPDKAATERIGVQGAALPPLFQ